MKYDAEAVYKKARKEGAGIDNVCPCPNYDCRYKTAEEINEELERGRLRDLGEAIGCFVAVVLGSVAMYLFLCL